MSYPSTHFPGTPVWAQAAIDTAIERTGMNAEKWRAPLGAIGRYESNWNNAANLCLPVEDNAPLAAFQLAHGMYVAARENWPSLVPLIRKADPECSATVAILYINSQLPGYGGYQGIGQLDGTKGLVPRTDRGPGNVLRAWVADPANFSIEGSRSLYKGY